MKKIILKPHLFFLGIIPIVFIFGYLNKEATINIEYFGGVFTINLWSITLFSCVFFLLISFNYLTLFWTNKSPKKILSLLHITLQIVSFCLFFYYKKVSQATNNEQLYQINDFLIFSFFVFIIATMIHLINFFITLISKSKEH